MSGIGVRPFKNGIGYSAKTTLYTHNCNWCGAEFRGSFDKSFCSTSCRVNSWRNGKRAINPTKPRAVPQIWSWGRTRFAVLERDGFRCKYCGRGHREDVALHVDHILPRSEGGSNDMSNLVAACAECNLAKSNRLIEFNHNP